MLEELGTGGREPVQASITLAICEANLGDAERARVILDQAAAVARAQRDEPAIAVILNNLGNLALNERQFAQARVHLEESVAMFRRLGMPDGVAYGLGDLGFIALAEARDDDAAAAFRETLTICRAEEIVDGKVIFAVEGLAAVALTRRDPARAARLLAATTRPRANVPNPPDFYPIGEETRARTLEAARAALDEATFAAAWAEGEALSLEAAAETAAGVD